MTYKSIPLLRFRICSCDFLMTATSAHGMWSCGLSISCLRPRLDKRLIDFVVLQPQLPKTWWTHCHMCRKGLHQQTHRLHKMCVYTPCVTPCVSMCRDVLNLFVLNVAPEALELQVSQPGHLVLARLACLTRFLVEKSSLFLFKYVSYVFLFLFFFPSLFISFSKITDEVSFNPYFVTLIIL